MSFLNLYIAKRFRVSGSSDSWEDATELSQSESPPDNWDYSLSLEPEIGNERLSNIAR